MLKNNIKVFRLIYGLLGLIIFQSGNSQNFGLELLSNIKARPTYNDIWGYVDKNGHEYAIIGANNGTLIYLLDDPKNPQEVAFMPGDPSIWRDIKHFGDYIYVVADQGQNGIGIINMKNAPESITFRYWAPRVSEVASNGDTIFSGQQLTAHNLYIDDKGYAYLAGSGRNVNPGIMIYDVRDGENPAYAGYANTNYCHDAYVKNDRLYTSDIFGGGFSIFDVKDKKKPVLLGFSQTGRTFTHNAWLSDDGKYLYTTDERATAYIEGYDVSNPTDIRFLSRYRPKDALLSQVIPHNVHFHQNGLYISYYTDGVKVVDARVPNNLVEIASFDTYLPLDQGYHGCWGAYPYLPSGLVIASDIESGLFVLKPTFKPAALLTGHITDMVSGKFLDGVTVEIKHELAAPVTSFNQGKYNTGIGVEGNFSVEYYHPDYELFSISLPFVSGQDLLQNVALKPKSIYQTTFRVEDENGQPLPNAQILLTERDVQVSATVGLDGQISLPIKGSQYQLFGAKWGYQTSFQSKTILQNEEVVIKLKRGYYDDFSVDLGWNVGGAVSAGAWVREQPIGTRLNQVLSNPEMDIMGDFGSQCYVTGNGYGAVGDFDVDQGITTITSPPFNLTGLVQPQLEIQVWFGSWAGSMAPNDSMNLYLVRGQERRLLESITTPTPGWVTKKYTLANNLGDGWSLQVTVSDLPGQEMGHVVEGAIDGFKLLDRTTAIDPIIGAKWKVYPNPFKQALTVEWDDSSGEVLDLWIINLTGQSVWRQKIQSGQAINLPGDLPAGLYLGELNKPGLPARVIKLIKSD